MIEATRDGLIYNSETNEIISQFIAGNKLYLASNAEIFYGTIDEFLNI